MAELTKWVQFKAGRGFLTMRRRTQLVGYLFLLPALALLGLFIAYPIVHSLVISFLSWDGVLPWRFVGLDNFERLLNDGRFYDALWHNLVFMVLTTVGIVGLGFLLALAIERRVRGWQVFKIIYFLPVMLPMTVTGMLWGRILEPTLGPVNSFLRAIGLEALALPWLGDVRTSLPVIIVVTIWQYAGFGMILLLAAMENIPTDIHDAATIDGVDTIQRARYIILPMVSRVLAVVIMVQMIFSFKVFDIVWVMTHGGPGESSQILGTYLYRQAFQYHYLGYGSALALAMSAIIFAISIVYQRVFQPERSEF